MRQKHPSIILLVEPDDNVRPVLKNNLQNWGYRIIMTLDGTDALQRTRSGRESFGLILLNQVDESITFLLDLGRQIRQHSKLSGRIPIVILAERYGAEVEGQDLQVGENEYVSYLEDGQQLKNLLYQLCPVLEN
jgi:CheY-like chemotaxis protein